MPLLRYSIFTDEITPDFERALDIALEYGFKHVEVRGLYGQNISELSPENLKRAQGALSARGMRVASIAGPVFKCFLYPEAAKTAGDTHNVDPDQELAEHLRRLDHSIEMAHAFGTRVVRTFAFWRQREPDEQVYRDIVEQMAPALEKARAADVVLALENEHACFVGSAAESIELLKRIDSPHLGLIWDAGNACFLGEKAFPDGYRRLRDEVGLHRIAHVHVKDARLDETTGKWSFCALGDGVVDFFAHFEELLADGYDGAVSIETHYQKDGSKEAASRESMAYLRSIAGRGALAGKVV